MTLDHLLPSVRETTLRSKEERISKLHSDCWIGYNGAEQILQRLEELLLHPKRLRMPNMLIISPTNNGKTMIIEKFRRNHLPHGSEDGTHEIIPVLTVQMPSSPTLQRFYAVIISSLNSPVLYTSTARYETMVVKLLRATKTKILIIDELHNILAGDDRKQREFLNVIRFIGNELQLCIIGVGIKDAYLAIRSDDQLENRFEPFILPLWKNNNDFTRLLASFERILPLQKPSNLIQEDIIKFILERSEGTIGEIAKLLTQASCDAIRSGKEYIDLETVKITDYRSPSERRKLYESIIYS